MKLLLDENLSFRLCRRLADLFEVVHHVDDFGLDGTSDGRIWDFAKGHGYAIVTQDRDFIDRVLVDGTPPKIVWIRLGNASVSTHARLMRDSRERLIHFEHTDGATHISLPPSTEP